MTDQAEVDGTFICESPGRDGLFGVFEDDGETGYLYVYEPGNRGVLNHLHIYDRNPLLEITEQDVQVTWSSDFQKCGVVIWGKFRGIINVATNQEGRVWLERRDTPGIGDSTWLSGFRRT